MDLTRLPKDLVVFYERRQSARPGPKPALSLDGVVGAGIAIADAEGLAGVSMAKVAERLGFTTMSLYRYVRSKDDLIMLMADAANSDVVPTPDPQSWRTGIENWARGVFGVYRRHPWMLQLPMSTPPAAPSTLRWMEFGLRNLATLDTPIGFKLQIIQLLHGYARGEAQLSADLSAKVPDDDPALPYGDILRAVTDPVSQPLLTELVASGIFDGSTEYDDDVDFEFGLRTILDGVERQADQLVSPPPPA
jgi:AcrR family transcriptional regulator